jgi:adenine-specific DNA methylase
MKEYDARLIIRNGKLKSELDLERAQEVDKKLMLLAKDDPALEGIRKKIRDLVIDYENLHWRDETKVTDQQILENDQAEIQVALEQEFLKRRKKLITSRLSVLGLKEKDLGILLNHNKTYTAELLAGTRAFSLNHLILLHLLLRIPLKDLIPVSVPEEVERRVRTALPKIAAGNLTFKDRSLELVKLGQ